MARDNSLFSLDIQSYQTKKRPTTINFEDESERLPETNSRNKKRKHKRTTVAKEDCENILV